MIHYESFELNNGLKVLVHQDRTSPVATMNILYDVGSRDESEEKTGFAHLFEHLMFGGSQNIPVYDEPLQAVGGENNAFTSPDITNYYLTLPSVNLETAFWLESDRMMGLSFKPEPLEVQRKVVIEEFKQRYLNQPYGDVWLKLRPLAYKTHPYKWATIGKEISHIENASLEDVKEFFYKHYLPNNAIMVLAGDVSIGEVEKLAKKWFEPIPAGKKTARNLPQEARQTDARFEHTQADVPVNMLYKCYQMCERNSDLYHATDLLSDVLGRSKSSRLYKKLVEEKRLFSSIQAYVTGSMDKGLLTVQAKLNEGVAFEEANTEIEAVIEGLKNEKVQASELKKVKNQAETTLVFGEIEVLNRAMNLAYAQLLGNADLVNQEAALLQAVSQEQLLDIAQEVFRKENCSTLFYEKKK